MSLIAFLKKYGKVVSNGMRRVGSTLHFLIGVLFHREVRAAFFTEIRLHLLFFVAILKRFENWRFLRRFHEWRANLKVTNRRSGLGWGIPLVMAVLMMSSAFVYRVYAQNGTLSREVMSLSGQVDSYTSMTASQLDTINKLKAFEATASTQIDRYNEEYKQLADYYISGRISSSLASRANGDPGQSFLSDINDLRTLLDGINSINTQTITGDLKFTDAEARIRAYMDAIPTLWPTYGNLTSYFGNRNMPGDYSWIGHRGIDIPASYGQEIYASASGIVTLSGWDSGYGLTVSIDHLNGLKTFYAHCSQLLVSVGQQVSKGEVIALIGSTGDSTGPHLHFEVFINGSAVDPLNFLQ